jgi:integrase
LRLFLVFDGIGAIKKGVMMHYYGTDSRYIQNLLGHSSSKTTEVYTHVTSKALSGIKSPLDSLDI